MVRLVKERGGKETVERECREVPSTSQEGLLEAVTRARLGVEFAEYMQVVRYTFSLSPLLMCLVAVELTSDIEVYRRCRS